MALSLLVRNQENVTSKASDDTEVDEKWEAKWKQSELPMEWWHYKALSNKIYRTNGLKTIRGQVPFLGRLIQISEACKYIVYPPEVDDGQWLPCSPYSAFLQTNAKRTKSFKEWKDIKFDANFVFFFLLLFQICWSFTIIWLVPILIFCSFFCKIWWNTLY